MPLDDLTDLYRPLAQTIEQREHQALLDLYCAEYQKKYSTDPVFDLNNAHLTTIKDIRRMCGKKSSDIVRHYFQMKDEWFLKMGHSLETLKKSIATINADMGKRGSAGAKVGPKGLALLHNELCDKCGRTFQIPYHLDAYPPPPYICWECEKT